jgi:fructoselysine-6-P-deglycase FrlB-like protein
VQFVACGTSYHAGLYAAKLFEEYADVRASAEIASEYEFTGGRDPERRDCRHALFATAGEAGGRQNARGDEHAREYSDAGG